MTKQDVTVTGTKNGFLFTKGNGSQFIAESGLAACLTFLEAIALKDELHNVKDKRKFKVTIEFEELN